MRGLESDTVGIRGSPLVVKPAAAGSDYDLLCRRLPVENATSVPSLAPLPFSDSETFVQHGSSFRV
jgi:hypothetical protein